MMACGEEKPLDIAWPQNGQVVMTSRPQPHPELADGDIGNCGNEFAHAAKQLVDTSGRWIAIEPFFFGCGTDQQLAVASRYDVGPASPNCVRDYRFGRIHIEAEELAFDRSDRRYEPVGEALQLARPCSGGDDDVFCGQPRCGRPNAGYSAAFDQQLDHGRSFSDTAPDTLQAQRECLDESPIVDLVVLWRADSPEDTRREIRLARTTFVTIQPICG